MLPQVTNLRQVAQDASGTTFAWDSVEYADVYSVSVDGVVVASPTQTTIKVNPAPGPHTFGVVPYAMPTAPSTLPFTVPVPVKQDLVGFVDRGTVSPAYAWMLGGVCNVRWDQLQTGPGSALIAGNPIDQAIATVRAFNGSTGARGFRVRIFVSSNAPGHYGQPPTWPQKLGGNPIPVTDPASNSSGYVGHYFGSVFQQAYAELMAELVAAYDLVPELRSVTLASSTLLYPEPLLKYPPSLSLIAAGDTLALEEAAITAMIAAHAAWKQTPQTFSFNPANYPNIGGLTYTLAEMDAFRAALGAKRAVLMNNSVRASYATGTGTMQSMYAAMKTRGGPIALQTATIDKMGDAATTFGFCVSLGAQSVELPVYTGIPESLLESYQPQLVANAA